MRGVSLWNDLFALFVERGQSVHRARSAGLDHLFPSYRTDLTHENGDVFIVQLEDA
jgi:hypothetical protein